MSKSVALGMLRQGSTGAQILEILNVIEQMDSEQTINEIADILF